MSQLMDWTPTNPSPFEPDNPYLNTYSDPYHMPGAWPVSPLRSEREAISCKRKHQEEVTPFLRRVRRKIEEAQNAIRNFQPLRQRPTGPNWCPIGFFQDRAQLKEPDAKDKAKAIPARRLNNVPEIRGMQGTPVNQQSRRDYNPITLPEEPHTMANEEAHILGSRRNSQPKSTLNVAHALQDMYSSSSPPSVKSMNKTMTAGSRRATKKWARFAQLSTTIQAKHSVRRLPTPPSPEPELPPELPKPKLEITSNDAKPLVETKDEKPAVRNGWPNIFENMPVLRPLNAAPPSISEIMQTPPPSSSVDSSFVHGSTLSTAPTPVGEPNLRAQSVSSDATSESYDSAAKQLQAEYYAGLDASDADSDAGSELFNSEWLPFNLRPQYNASLVPSEKAQVGQETTGAQEDSSIALQARGDQTPLANPLSFMAPSIASQIAPDTPARQLIDALTADAGSALSVSNLSIVDESPTKADTPKAGFHAQEKLRRLTRQRALKEKARQDALNQYEIVPLSQEWDDKVRQAVRQGHNNYAASDLARVVPQYAGRGQDNWLNDESINGYLDLIVKHGRKNDRDTQTPSHHAFNSFFYANICKKGVDSVARWSKRAKINGKELLNVERVFIPINSGSHWTLAVVEGTKKRITHYNSLSTRAGIVVCERIKEWVAMELGREFKEDEWTIEATGVSPLQNNSDDCGVFTVTSARQIMLGMTPSSYRADQIQIQRKRIVAELVAGELLRSKEAV